MLRHCSAQESAMKKSKKDKNLQDSTAVSYHLRGSGVQHRFS